MGLKWKPQKRNPLEIIQTIQEQPVVVVENENQGEIDELTQVAEQEFAALVQSQLALATQLDTIRNNIRVNHFKAKYSTVVSIERQIIIVLRTTD